MANSNRTYSMIDKTLPLPIVGAATPIDDQTAEFRILGDPALLPSSAEKTALLPSPAEKTALLPIVKLQAPASQKIRAWVSKVRPEERTFLYPFLVQKEQAVTPLIVQKVLPGSRLAVPPLIEAEADGTRSNLLTVTSPDDTEAANETIHAEIPVLTGGKLPPIPTVQPKTEGKLARLTRPVYWLSAELPLLLGLLVIGVVAHGLNMFNYPALNRFDDEGIYVSQAWSVLRLGKLAPYTYFYDHAPGGWLFLAGWQGLSGGPLTFGGSIDNGRMLMLLLHLASVVLLYQVVRKLGGGVAPAALAALLFSVSPLATTYQRLVMLDNIMIFWVLLSLNFLLDGRGRLSRLIFSGVCFGLAVLSKETVIFLLPALLFLAWQQRWKHQGRFGVLGWVIPMLCILSLYPLYALFKGELLPAGYSLAFFILNVDTPPGTVSLLDSLKWQATRGGDGIFMNLVNTAWLKLDPILFVGGGIASGLNILRILRRNRQAFAAGLLGLLPLYYLARGGVVFDFYVIFAIPFLCLNLALLFNPVFKRLPSRVGLGLVAVMIGALVASYWVSGALQPLYTARPDQANREAMQWIKQNVPSQSLMVVRNDMWVDLHEQGLGGPAFPNAHSHWKVALDPAIRDQIFHNDWHTVDYVVVTHQLRQDLADTNAKFVLEALDNSTLVKRWETEGNLIELWKVNNQKQVTTEAETAQMLSGSAAYMANRFEQNSGAYSETNGKVRAENQAYAMLRSVWLNDRAQFERVWRWTQANLATQNRLLVAQWQQGKVLDPAISSEANTDAALALLFAGKNWNDPALLSAGTSLVKTLWERNVVVVGSVPYMAAGDWATQGNIVTLNPGYFAPYAYRVFQEVDPQHNWLALIDAGYKLLFDASSDTLGLSRSAGLPPEWVGLERASGKLVSVGPDTAETSRYAFEAAHTYWRVALDQNWSGDGRAKSYLEQAGFLRDEVLRKGTVSAIYAHDGTLVEKTPSVVGNGSALAALLTLDASAANRLYIGQLLGQTNRTSQGLYWDNPNDLYAQGWGWFATALYAKTLPDLWHVRG